MSAFDPNTIIRISLLTGLAIGSAKGALMVLRKISKMLSTMRIKRAQPLFTKLYRGVDGFEVSMSAREAIELKGDEYTYGEIVFSSFAKILDLVRPQPREVFYDLGCGSGKAVFAMAILHPDSKPRGIELLEPMYQLCLQQLDKYNQLLQSNTFSPKKDTDIQFFNEDILKYDFTDGDIIFLNATCFPAEAWKQINLKLGKLKKGARVICTTKELSNPKFTLAHQGSHLMSWGINSVHIYLKEL